MKKMKDSDAQGYDYAYKHKDAEVRIKFDDITDNVDLINIKIATKEADYSFVFVDKFDTNGKGKVKTSALVKKEDKDGKTTTLLNTDEYEYGNIITSVRVYGADIITRGKKLLNKKEYEQLGLFELFNNYVPENMKGLEEKLNRSYTILPVNNSRGY